MLRNFWQGLFGGTIVKNIALKILNNNKREFADEEEFENASDTVDNEDDIIARFSVRELETILKKLPEDYYNVILMKTYMDFSTYDIAESLGITYENAKKRLSRARKRFKQLLEENDYHAAKP